jgi:hypothetical protein
MHRYRLLQNSHSFLLSSSDTVCILSLLLFLGSQVNFVYLLDPQLPACMPIKLDPLISHPEAWEFCVALAMLTMSHSHRRNEMWRPVSICLRTKICFSYALWKRRCGTFGLRSSPTCDPYPALSLLKKSSVLLWVYYRWQWELLEPDVGINMEYKGSTKLQVLKWNISIFLLFNLDHDYNIWYKLTTVVKSLKFSEKNPHAVYSFVITCSWRENILSSSTHSFLQFPSKSNFCTKMFEDLASFVAVW